MTFSSQGRCSVNFIRSPYTLQIERVNKNEERNYDSTGRAAERILNKSVYIYTNYMHSLSNAAIKDSIQKQKRFST